MIELTEVDGVATVKPNQDVVASLSNELRTTLKQALDAGATDIILDLVGVEMIDSSGLGAMIAGHNSLKKK